MPRYRYPVPTESPFDDFCQYIPLLIAAVQQELDRDSVWDDSDIPAARLYMKDLLAYLSELNCGGTMDYSKAVNFTQADNGTLTLDASPPANSILASVIVVMTTAAGGSSSSIKVGVSGTLEKYMTAGENRLFELGSYEVFTYSVLGSSPAAIIATIVASSHTFAGQIILRYLKL